MSPASDNVTSWTSVSTNHCSLSDYSHRSNRPTDRMRNTGNADEAERAMRRRWAGYYLRAAHQPLAATSHQKTPSVRGEPRGKSQSWRSRGSILLRKGALHPAGDDGEATGAVHGEEAEGTVEVHADVGDVVAFLWQGAGYRAEGGDGSGFEPPAKKRASTSWAPPEMASGMGLSPRQVRCRDAQESKSEQVAVGEQVVLAFDLEGGQRQFQACLWAG